MSTKGCNHCKMDTAIRNPSGFCDHLYYPDNDCVGCHQDTKQGVSESHTQDWRERFDATCGVGMPDGVSAEVKSFIAKEITLAVEAEKQKALDAVNLELLYVREQKTGHRQGGVIRMLEKILSTLTK